MSDKILYWASMTFGVVGLFLLLVNTALISSNHKMQDEVTSRQIIINQANQLSQINQALVQALVDTVLRNNDAEIKDLLTSQGIIIHSLEKTGSPDDQKSKTKKK